MTAKKHIFNELNDLGISLPVVSMPEMSVPTNYFEDLSMEVLSAIEINRALAGLPSQVPYEIPKDYFNTFASNIAQEIQLEHFIENLPAKLPFEVPNQYFDNLHSEIMELNEQELFLSSLPKVNAYDLPVGYFEHLSTNIISKTKIANNIAPLRATRNYYSKMSIAASLFVILALGFLLMTQNSKNSGSIESQLAQISDNEINDYIEEHAFEFDHHLSYQAIDESQIDFNLLENEIYNSYFENISDEEMHNFL